MGYILDPHYLGDKMKRNLGKEIEDFIFNFPTEDGNTSPVWRDQLAPEYTSFRIKQLGEREQNRFRFRMIGKLKTVLQWWIADGTDWPLLQNVAIRVFSMAASAAASERNFSTFRFIHSKLHNRFGPEKVKKLVYIKTNAIQMADSKDSPTECYAMDSDEEEVALEVDQSQD